MIHHTLETSGGHLLCEARRQRADFILLDRGSIPNLDLPVRHPDVAKPG